jgi:hypothetical protein
MLDVFKSKKFAIGLAASLINGVLVALGVSIEVAILATSPLSGALLGQAAVDVRKAGPTAGSVASILLAVGLVTGAATNAGCGSLQRGGAAAIDCLAPNTAKLAGELTGVVADVLRGATDNTGRVDWSAVKASVNGFKSDGPRCAFRAAVAESLRLRSSGGVQSAGLEWSPDDLRAGYAAINAEVFGTRLAPL